MKKLHAVVHPRPIPHLRPMTLGWTEFGIIAVLVGLIILLGGFVVWP